MLRITLLTLALASAAMSHAAQPVIDNARVTVWDTTSILPPSPHDFIAVSLARPGTIIFGRHGEVPSKAGDRTIVIELKDGAVAALANNSGYPLAFPRPRAAKLFENDRVIVWDYVWTPGEPTPMHFHDKDALVVWEASGGLKSTTPDGKSIVNEYKIGDVRFNARDRSHTELLISGQAHAVITELK